MISGKEKPVVIDRGKGSLVEACKQAAYEAGWDKHKIDEIVTEMFTRRTFDDVIRVIKKYFDLRLKNGTPWRQ